MSESTSSMFSLPSHVEKEGTPKPPTQEGSQPPLQFWIVAEALLKDRERLFQEIEEETTLRSLIPHLIWITLLCTSIVGAILGSYTGGWQVLFVAIKLPMLFLFTLGLCLSAFWSWSLYFRLPLHLLQVIALSLMCIAVTSLLLLGLSPFLWQLLSGQSKLYHWAILAMVGAFSCAGFGGVRVLSQGLQHLEDAHLRKCRDLEEKSDDPSDLNSKTMRTSPFLSWVWISIYGFVGLQVSWILRPYLSHPWSKFATPFVRAWEGNVFASLLKTLASALGL